MNIDERLEFLRQSTESLHDSVQELHATVAEQGRQQQLWIERQERLEARERKARTAITAGIAAYLDALREDGAEQ